MLIRRLDDDIGRLADAIIGTNNYIGIKELKILGNIHEPAKRKVTIIDFFKLLKEGLNIKDRYDKILFLRRFNDAIKNIDVKKAISEVAAMKNPELTIFFFDLLMQQKSLDVSTDELVNSVLETNNARYIYKLALVAPKELINKLADAIIETRDAFYMYLFAENIPDAPLAKLIIGIAKTEDNVYIELVKTKVINKTKNKCKVFSDIIEELEKQNISISHFISLFVCGGLPTLGITMLSDFFLFKMVNLRINAIRKIKTLIVNPNSLPLLESGETSLVVVSNNQQVQTKGINSFDECFFQQITGICNYIVRESDKLIPSMKDIVTSELKTIFECFSSEIPYLGKEAVINLYNKLEGLKLALDYQLPPINEMQSESNHL